MIFEKDITSSIYHLTENDFISNDRMQPILRIDQMFIRHELLIEQM
jgi:hypothetical protein